MIVSFGFVGVFSMRNSVAKLLLAASALAGCGHPSTPATRPASRPNTAPATAPATLPVPQVTTAPVVPSPVLTTNAAGVVVTFGTATLTGCPTPFTSDAPTIVSAGTGNTAHVVATSPSTGIVVTTDYAISGPDLIRTITLTVPPSASAPVVATLDLETMTLAGTPDGFSDLDWTNGYGFPGSGRVWPSNANQSAAAEADCGGTLTLTYCRELTTAAAPHLIRPNVIDNLGPRPVYGVQFYDAGESIAPGASLTRTVVTRFATTTGNRASDIAALYAGYRAVLPPLPPSRSVNLPAVACDNVNATWARADNPGGDNDGGDGSVLWRRPDRVDGAAALAAYMHQNFAGRVGEAIWWDGGGWFAGPDGKPVIWGTDTVANQHRIDATRPLFQKPMAADGIESWVCYRLDVDRSDADTLKQVATLVGMGFTGLYLDSPITPADRARVPLIARNFPKLALLVEGDGFDDTTPGGQYYDELRAPTFYTDATGQRLPYATAMPLAVADAAAGNLRCHTADQVAKLYYLRGARAMVANPGGVPMTAGSWAALGPAVLPIVGDQSSDQLPAATTRPAN